MTNNDILRRLRYALTISNDQMVEMFGLMDFYYLLIIGSINTMFQRYSDILFNQSDNMLTVHRECPYPLDVGKLLMLSNRVCHGFR